MNRMRVKVQDLELLAKGLNAMPRGPQAQQLSLLQLIIEEVSCYLVTFPNVFGGDPSESLHLITVRMDTGAEVPVALQSGSQYYGEPRTVLHVYYGVGVRNMRMGGSNKAGDPAHGHIMLLGSPAQPRLVYWRTPHVRTKGGRYQNFLVYQE
ncbi:MAG TPA: hypothetical protein VNG90_05070 [Candidatus Acidoferrum sp.]|nr:hypothetical protein [Candidatus Acidoferrum sp.]